MISSSDVDLEKMKICDNCKNTLHLIFDNGYYICSCCGIVIDEDHYVTQQIPLFKQDKNNSTGNKVGLTNTLIGNKQERSYGHKSKINYHKLNQINLRMDQVYQRKTEFLKYFKDFNDRFGFGLDEYKLIKEAILTYNRITKGSRFRNIEMISKYIYYQTAKKTGIFIPLDELEVNNFWDIKFCNDFSLKSSEKNYDQLSKTLLSNLCVEFGCEESIYKNALRLIKYVSGKDEVRVCSSFLTAYGLKKEKSKRAILPYQLADRFGLSYSSVYSGINKLNSIVSSIKSKKISKKPISQPLSPSITSNVTPLSIVSNTCSPVINSISLLSPSSSPIKSLDCRINTNTNTKINQSKHYGSSLYSILKSIYKFSQLITNPSLSQSQYSQKKSPTSCKKSNDESHIKSRLYSVCEDDTYSKNNGRCRRKSKRFSPNMDNLMNIDESPPSDIKYPPKYFLYLKMGIEYEKIADFYKVIQKFSCITHSPPSNPERNSIISKHNANSSTANNFG